MKVLFVTLFPFEENTSVTISSYGLLTGLHELGYEVTILEPLMDKSDEPSCSFDLSPFIIECIPGAYFRELRKPRKRTIWNRIRHKIHKSFDFLDFTSPILRSANKVSVQGKYYDFIISVSDPKTSHLFAKRLIDRGLRYGRWIQHWGDPLNGDITRKNCYPDSIIQLYERRIIRHADRVVYVSPFTADMQRKAYPDLIAKIAFVPLPYVHDNHEITQDAGMQSSVLKLAYLGDYSSRVRNIKPLYEACERRKDVELIIAGNSDLKLQSKENITVLPRVPFEKARQIEEQADVSVCVCNLKGTQIPGKLYYSASTQKHILVILDGDEQEAMMNYLCSFNRYVVCENTVSSIEDTLGKISKMTQMVYCAPSQLRPQTIVERILDERGI